VTLHPRTAALRAVTETEWSNVVKRAALRHGICGFHIRQSEGNLEGVHSSGNSDHSDAHGFPDWLFFHPDGRLLAIELKNEWGRVLRPQWRYQELFARVTRVEPYVLRPSDFDALDGLFRGA